MSPETTAKRTSDTLRKESRSKLIIFFIIIAVFALFFASFFLTNGPLSIFRTFFLKGYNSIPSSNKGVDIRDLSIFTVIYLSWYLFASIFSLEKYLIKRVILLNRIKNQHAETHGLKGL